MMNRKVFVVVGLCLVVLAAGCGKKEEAAPPVSSGSSSAPSSPAVSAAPAPTPVATPAPAPVAASAESCAAPTAFNINQIPVTEKPLGEFPFFTPPTEHRYIPWSGDTKPDNGRSLKKFTRHYYATGRETLHPVEGKTLKVQLYDEERESSTGLENLMIQRNYENAITTAGGIKIFDGIPDRDKTYRTLSKEDYYGYGPEVNSMDDPRQVYVIRTKDVEVWIEVSCGIVCYYTVTQKGEMKQTVGLVPASEMKAALDRDGHIALYINFDVDKSTVRPESEAIVAEIVKLLESNPDLRVRIEGHTDNTGGEAHNQTLSENRAAAVYGALLVKGIAQSRLQSAGFGATKPIADNATEEGKAKNRRVEIVKL
jgi:outer membrane protein OmpA-like peptidoglycan-associated protein